MADYGGGRPYRGRGRGRGGGGQGGGGRGRGRGGNGGQRGRGRGGYGGEGRGDQEQGNGQEGRGGQRAEDVNRPRGPPRIGYTKLKLLLEEGPDDILMSLNRNMNGMKEILVFPMKKDWVNLVLAVLSRGCQCTMVVETLVHVLTMVHDTDFIDRIIPTRFLEMTKERSVHEQEQFAKPIKDVLELCSQLLQRIPNHAYDKVFLCLSTIEQSIRMLRAKTSIIDQDIEGKVEEVKALLEESSNRVEPPVPEQKRRGYPDRRDEEQPPNDFRTIPIAPTRGDLFIRSRDDAALWLRRNKARGQYLNVDHYLDVQFRLLREDFVRPLRDGLKEYRQHYIDMEDRKARLQNVRVYTNIHIIRPVCTNNGLTYRIRLDTKLLKNVKWKFSKRLIFGSLVCLSRDNFQTLLFATVTDRKPEDLEKVGELEIKFEDFNEDVAAAVRNMELSYTMLETSAYFEAYRHILKGLQDTNDDNMPFKRYIVDCERVIRPPEYLGPRSIYDLRPIIQGTTKERRLRNAEADDTDDDDDDDDDEPETRYVFTAAAQFARRIPILHDASWPGAEQLGVDESQLKALKTCLTKEFSIIQGPPGTGKTFIGLKVIEVLLHNHKVWTEDPITHVEDRRPVLVVCYTNHALDQFLEEVTKFYDKNLLRVGGRSNSEVLKKYTMRSVRSKVKEKKEVPRLVHDGLRAAFDDMKKLQATLETTVQKSEVVEKGIIHEEHLRKHINDQHWRSLLELTDVVDGRVCLMAEWLGFGKSALSDFVEPENPEAVDEEVLDDDMEDEELEVEGDLDFIEDQRKMDDELDPFYYTDPNAIVAGIGLLGLEESDMDTEIAEAGGWQRAAKPKKRKEQLKRQLKSCDAMKEEDAANVHRIWQLGYQDRWRLYRHWIGKYLQEINANIERQQELYSQATARMREARDQEDLAIMRTATVIGMTTTGAAKYRTVMQEIQPRIVIVEEAAEVLESHIITTLSRGCQHVILIGDHKQLRPSPAVYELAMHYNLDISLFERMVKNELHLECLQYQHRMRPEISNLIKLIYPDLRDHQNVLKYEDIKGVSTNMFFINHHMKEKEDLDSRSHSNKHEAEYIARLCKHLLLQGYAPSQITVLTPYTGQLFALKDKSVMDKKTFEGVKITVVDNYQGEENDIILLSLVRSNNEGRLGFLKIQNRICVALSRAKKAMYVIGNFDMMMKNSEDWSKTIQLLVENKMYGPQLVLQCPNHPDVTIPTKVAEDFNKAPEGGCSKPCDHRLSCGHQCPSACHVKNADHKLTKCYKPCEKRCPEGHKCRKICHEKCGSCKERCRKRLPRCNHDQVVYCHEDPALVICKSPCKHTLLCGHRCGNSCGEAHTAKCQSQVQKTWPCGCKSPVQCHVDVTTTPCPKKCETLLSCLHPCPGTCGDCLQGRIHAACRQTCGRTLVCGHNCKFPCTKECPPCEEKCLNRCIHSKCTKRCGEPCIPCNEHCQWSCPHYQCNKVCHELCDRPRCDQPCLRRLRCRHFCIGLCGEPCPKLCRECNKDEVTEVLFGDEDEPDARFIQLEDCGHVIEVGGMDQWMDAREEAVGPEGISIQMKKCPRCSIPIRKHLRYGSIVKQTLKDIEAVKVHILGERHLVKDRHIHLNGLLHQIHLGPYNARSRIKGELDRPNVTMATLDLIENTLEFLRHLEKVRKDVAAHLRGKPRGEKLVDDCNLIEERLLKLCQRISEQQVNDFQMEVTRLSKATKLTLYLQKIIDGGFQNCMPAQVFGNLQMMLDSITNGTKFTDEAETAVDKVVIEVEKHIPKSGLGISEDERVMIVKAMGMSQGHWYKCPNGHPYAIGDCGGAMVETKCPECKATIGGRNHALTAGNRHAGEMDGSRHAAWSEGANLGNYGNIF
ncbi:NFX1-type zinc finger-containing protein 1-like [Lineus longissimus]|uniref:NFX1-type zinc finger-containing protein 1-like n=1 Tax=Lineus longissimus TaxID=88925 RepID=UPI00315CB854